MIPEIASFILHATVVTTLHGVPVHIEVTSDGGKKLGACLEAAYQLAKTRPDVLDAWCTLRPPERGA